MEKIKDLFANFYANKKLFWPVVCGAAALLVILGVVLALCLGGDAPMTDCAITVKTEGGMPLEGIAVSVFEDAEKTKMVTYAKTDAEGKVVVGEVPAGSVAVLAELPAGYVAEESYAITQKNTEIVVKIELLKEMSPITLGGVMFDFTVTDTDGLSYTLSELLKEKDAVVLNLWYTNCGPCKAEFPYLQQAYDKYSDKVALLALDPVSEDNEAAVAAFKVSNGLTFPMAKVDAAWEQQIEGIAYPTTVVIDRFGTVALLHVGGIDAVGVFEGVFEHFTAEDYTQSTVADIQFLKIEVEVGAGTKENPMEFTGVEEFEVTVEAGQTVYCNLYRVAGKELTVASENVKVLYGEQEFVPAEGVVTCVVNTPDPSTPALVAFTNTGSAAETYKVTLAPAEGSMEKPFELQLDAFSVNVAEGNYQGVFYTYTAQYTGDLIITLNKAPENVKYGIALNNITTSKYLTMEENGVEADGKMTLTVEANKDNELQLIVTVQPDAEGKYAAADFELETEFKAKATISEGSSGNSGGSTGGNSSGGNSGGSTGNYDGTLVNADDPQIEWGLNDFSVEVGAGEKKLIHIGRVVNKGTLCIYDSSAYVVKDGKTYKPNSSGNVFVAIEAETSQDIIELHIGNSGSSNKTYSVKFYFSPGTRENPIKLELGENTVSCAAGNDQGANFVFEASKTGILTLKVKSISPDNVACGITIDAIVGNTSEGEIPTQVVLEEGSDTISVQVKAGTEAKIVISTSDPDREWKIPKATIVVEATFE